MVRGGGAGFRGTGNGGGTFLYDMENLNGYTQSNRYQGSVNATYTPAPWASFEALYSYDNRTTLGNSGRLSSSAMEYSFPGSPCRAR